MIETVLGTIVGIGLVLNVIAQILGGNDNWGE
jgi:hypothetical protein